MGIFEDHCRAAEEREFAGVFRLLNRLYKPKPRMILAKALSIASVRPKAVKKTAKPAPKPVIVRKPQLSDRELAVFLGDATVRGLLSGSLALQVQKDVDAGRKMPAEVRAILVAAYGGQSGK